jgi:ribosomal protein S18 acetylase RimI-like enzyme
MSSKPTEVVNSACTMTRSMNTSIKATPIVRLAELKDAAAIATLGSETFASTFGHSMPVADLQAYLQSAYSPLSIANDLSNPLIGIFVACDSHDHVIGFVQLTQGTIEPCVKTAEAPIELQRLYIRQGYHGRGVGKALEEFAEDVGRKMGFKTIWLGVWEENFRAHKVYERFGFGKIGYHDFKIGDCVQTDWIMSKRL